MKAFKVYPATLQEMKLFEQLRLAYGMKTMGHLCRYLLTKEAERKGLLQERIDQLKNKVN